ncbi:PfkB family carbohydrate kinase [Pseudaestuariivita sp.]|uniref:PfkB family carbohydrate kinase n=1 Tax=Pseudaestuariivita sp. TaxID=2211669 RepID=UPI0040597DE5
MTQPQFLCIGSVLWDIIGRSASHMGAGSDVPGRITRIPGGVALNIAMTLRRFGIAPALLSAVGEDAEGRELVAACADLGLDVGYLYRSDDLPTDRYMAIEGAGGLVAAIADAHSLERAGDKILRPLQDGRLGHADQPFQGDIALDGNLTLALLSQIAVSPLFSACRLHVAPASPGKAERLLPFVEAGRGQLYVNLEEAGTLCQTTFNSAEAAAEGLLKAGAARALVTDGARPACDGHASGLLTAAPAEVMVTRVTGAGDTFMAAHIAAERRGEPRDQALATALTAAARYVSGDTGK